MHRPRKGLAENSPARFTVCNFRIGAKTFRAGDIAYTHVELHDQTVAIGMLPGATVLLPANTRAQSQLKEGCRIVVDLAMKFLREPGSVPAARV